MRSYLNTHTRTHTPTHIHTYIHTHTPTFSAYFLEDQLKTQPSPLSHAQTPQVAWLQSKIVGDDICFIWGQGKVTVHLKDLSISYYYSTHVSFFI